MLSATQDQYAPQTKPEGAAPRQRDGQSVALPCPPLRHRLLLRRRPARCRPSRPRRQGIGALERDVSASLPRFPETFTRRDATSVRPQEAFAPPHRSLRPPGATLPNRPRSFPPESAPSTPRNETFRSPPETSPSWVASRTPRSASLRSRRATLRSRGETFPSGWASFPSRRNSLPPRRASLPSGWETFAPRSTSLPSRCASFQSRHK